MTRRDTLLLVPVALLLLQAGCSSDPTSPVRSWAAPTEPTFPRVPLAPATLTRAK